MYKAEAAGSLARYLAGPAQASGATAPSLSTGSFPAGAPDHPPSSLTADIAALCSALPTCLSLRQSSRIHPGNGSCHLLPRPRGRKYNLRETEAAMLSLPICTKHRTQFPTSHSKSPLRHQNLSQHPTHKASTCMPSIPARDPRPVPAFSNEPWKHSSQ